VEGLQNYQYLNNSLILFSGCFKIGKYWVCGVYGSGSKTFKICAQILSSNP